MNEKEPMKYGGGRNEGKTERLMKQAYNEGVEAAAQHCCTICKAAENIRKLKK